MKQGRRERNKVQCRSRILKTSRQLFAAKGYEETTMDDVAGAAEVSKATLYNYFSSKENLLLGIAEAALEEILVLIEEDLVGEPSSLQKLRRVLETMVVDTTHYVALSRRIFFLNTFPDNELHGVRVELMQILEELVAEAQRQGELRQDCPAETLAELFLGLFLMALFCWEEVESGAEERCIRRIDDAVDQLLTGIGRQEA